MPMTDLPAPACQFGYTASQVLGVLGARRLSGFAIWMGDRGYVVCDGRRYDPQTRVYVATRCGPHGWVVASDDLKAFLKQECR